MSIASEIKDALEPITALGGRIGLDTVAEGETLPYVSMSPELSTDPDLLGDALVLAVRDVHQVDLWQDRDAESADLRDDVFDALNGLKITAPALRLRITGIARIVEPDYRVIHHAFTLTLPRITV